MELVTVEYRGETGKKRLVASKLSKLKEIGSKGDFRRFWSNFDRFRAKGM